MDRPLPSSLPASRRETGTRPSSRIWTFEERERLALIIFAYESGIAPADIGIGLGLSKQWVNALLRHAGVPKRREGNSGLHRTSEGRFVAPAAKNGNGHPGRTGRRGRR